MREFTLFPEELRRRVVNRTNLPFKNYIGQNGAIERILDLVYQGYSNKHHVIPENIMFAGPPSTGKTTLVKMLVETLGTPAALTDSNQVNGGVNDGDKRVPRGVDTVIHLILDAWTRTLRGALPFKKDGSFSTYDVPPMVVFIDEIHGLGRKAADALLKATERNDGMLFGKDIVMNCKNITWVGATTDWGKLPPAFRTRFLRIDLESPTREEVVDIIQLNHKNLDLETCKKIVFYGSLIPREALAFARTVERYAQRVGSIPKDCVWACAEREGIDKWGMHKKRLQILSALKNSNLNLRNLSSVIGCANEEVTDHWLPPLLFSKPALVKFDRPDYCITEEGIQELRKRGL